jgi:cell division protein FtsA
VEGAEMVDRAFVAEIAQARMQEIFEKVDAELRKVERSGMLPAGVVLTGGGVKIAGCVEAAKDAFRLPVTIGSALGISSVIDRAHDPAFSTSVGLVLWGRNIRGAGGGKGMSKVFGKLKGIGNITNSIKKLFSSLKP